MAARRGGESPLETDLTNPDPRILGQVYMHLYCTFTEWIASVYRQYNTGL